MAKKPLRECLKHGCRTLTRDGYCPTHLHIKTERHKTYDRFQRDKRAAAFYHSKPWQAASRAAIAKAGGLCLDCLKMGIIIQAQMVHHIKPLKLYPKLALEPSNLRPLCNKCHGKY